MLIEDLQMKIPTNAYFCHQRAPKLSNCVLKNLKRAFLGSFGSGRPQFFFLEKWYRLLGIGVRREKSYNTKILYYEKKSFNYHAGKFFVSTTQVNIISVKFKLEKI